MKRIVVDTSALIHTLTERALASHLVANYDQIAPRLIQWEVGNVVHSKEPATFGEGKKRKRVVSILLRHVRVVDQDGRLEEIADLVDKFGLTFYDAAFLQAAIDEESDLLSEDRKLLTASAKTLGGARVWDISRANAAMAKGAF